VTSKRDPSRAAVSAASLSHDGLGRETAARAVGLGRRQRADGRDLDAADAGRRHGRKLPGRLGLLDEGAEPPPARHHPPSGGGAAKPARGDRAARPGDDNVSTPLNAIGPRVGFDAISWLL
jgi:hypothetical protein